MPNWARIMLAIAIALLVAFAIDQNGRRVAREAAHDTRVQLERLSYELAIRARNSSVAGCRRSVEDRRDLVAFLRSAAAAREREGDFPVANSYRMVATRVRTRIVDCSLAFPPPEPPPSARAKAGT